MRRWGAGLLALAAGLIPALSQPAAASAAAGIPAIRHVFVLVLENESASTTFGASSPAPYLAKTLVSEGAFVPKYYGIGHESNDNYIAMISGQAPNPQNQADCQIFDDFTPGTIGADGQAIGSGCVFPTTVPTVAGQLSAAGLTWRDYDQSMGADPTREPVVCAHPGIGAQDHTQSATSADQYATRHNPFVYFHSIIDDTTLCDSHVVNLNLLPRDLQSAANTPNYVFISPDLCGDGHDATCADPSRPGGFAGIDQFLAQWVPMITSSPAYRQQNGLLMIIFDEASTSDTSSCCGEIAGPNSASPGIGGAGGGDTGAVLLSPCIKPGTVTQQPYNHYTMLRSVEDIFGLPHIGFAQLAGERSFGSDVFTRACGAPAVTPVVRVSAPGLASNAAATPKVKVSWRALAGTPVSFGVQVEQTNVARPRWRTLRRATKLHSLVFKARLRATYEFRVTVSAAGGLLSAPAVATTVVPSAAHVPGAHLTGRWRFAPVRDAWESHALIGSKGSRLTLRFRGASIELIGSYWPQGGAATVLLDGRRTTVRVSNVQPHARQVVFSRALAFGRHTLTLRVNRGAFPLEGVAIANWR